METILTILIALYLIIVFFIVIQKKINTQHKEPIKNDEESYATDYGHSKKWLDYSAGLKSSPYLEGYDRPDM